MKELEPTIITIPVMIRSGSVEFLHGGPLPKLREGYTGGLEIPADAFVNRKDVDLLSISETVEVMEKGATLYAHISLREGTAPPNKLTSLDLVSGFWGYGGFAPIVLQAPLSMTFRGIKKPAFEPCECKLPTINKNVQSLNEAYTRLSEFYEPHRRSHTGNVFQKVVYLPKGERFWMPLHTLRQKHRIAFEIKHFQSKEGLFADKK